MNLTNLTMKIIFRCAALAALLIIASCGKDSADDTAQQQQQEAEQLEQTPLEANTVSDNLLISGGTKMDGMPPAPTGTLSFDASGTSKSAFLNEGFDVTMSSDSPIVGAYIQIKAEDGTAADSYYDVNMDTNSLDNKSSKIIGKRTSKSTITKKENDFSLDVDFTNDIEPGKFCYEICVYDGAGNISNPQEVCVTVESWGGSSKIVGEWNLFEEVDIFGGESDTTLVGEEDCSGVEEIECNNENTFMTDYYCYLTHNSSLTFNADGTFEYTSSDSSKEIKLFESKESCEAIYDEVERSELSKGNWAYVQDTNDLILIMYSDVYTRNGETETENYEPGEGAIFAEIGIFLIDDVIRIGPGEESSENGYYRK